MDLKNHCCFSGLSEQKMFMRKPFKWLLLVSDLLKKVVFLPVVRHKSPRSLARSGSLTPYWKGSPGCTEQEAGRSKKGQSHGHVGFCRVDLRLSIASYIVPELNLNQWNHTGICIPDTASFWQSGSACFVITFVSRKIQEMDHHSVTIYVFSGVVADGCCFVCVAGEGTCVAFLVDSPAHNVSAQLVSPWYGGAGGYSWQDSLCSARFLVHMAPRAGGVLRLYVEQEDGARAAAWSSQASQQPGRSVQGWRIMMESRRAYRPSAITIQSGGLHRMASLYGRLVRGASLRFSKDLSSRCLNGTLHW